MSSLPVFADSEVENPYTYFFNYGDYPYYRFGSHSDYHNTDGNGYVSGGTWRSTSYNDNYVIKTEGFPALRLHSTTSSFDAEVMIYIHSCTYTENYVKASIFRSNLLGKYYFVIKQNSSLPSDFTNYANQSSYYNSIYTIRDGNTSTVYDLYNYYNVTNQYFTLLGYRYYYFTIRYAATDNYTANQLPLSNIRYNCRKYGTFTPDEVSALGTAVSDPNIEQETGTDPDNAEDSSNVTDTTVYVTYSTIIDSSAEEQKLSQFNSRLDEQDNKLLELNGKMSSNLEEVSSNLSDVKSLYSGALGWLPSWLIALIVCGAIMIIAVKIMGR